MDCKKEVENRVNFIKTLISKTGSAGIVFGNSGGKDCSLVGILCKMATQNTLAVQMPCHSKQNYNSDLNDALSLCKIFNIEEITVDLSVVRDELVKSIEKSIPLVKDSIINIAPRLRMSTLYAIARTKNMLVAGTGNKCERFVGYFTKFGDGACDFNPISDLTVSEIYTLLEFLGAPRSIIEKAPSAGLFEGQTDEAELGFLYSDIESYMENKAIAQNTKEKIEKMHNASHHKISLPYTYIDYKEKESI